MGATSPADLAPIINHCLDSFGPDRVMFGGDWPVCTNVATLRQWVEALKQIVGGRNETEPEEEGELWVAATAGTPLAAVTKPLRFSVAVTDVEVRTSTPAPVRACSTVRAISGSRGGST